MPSTAVALPTRSQIESWATAHLRQAARQWASTAESWEQSFDVLYRGALAPGGTDFDGATAEAVGQRALSDKLLVVRLADDLAAAASAATTATADIDAAKSSALAAIARAEDAGFDVAEDLSLSSRQEFTDADYAAKLAEAQRLAVEIRSAAAGLARVDAEAATTITAAVASFSEVSFPEAPMPAQSPGDPTVQLVDNKVPTDKTSTESDPGPGEETGLEGGAPKSWEDMLLPGAADAEAEGPEADPGVEVDPEQPKDLDEALSGVAGAPVAPAPGVVERFKDQMKAAGKGDGAADGKGDYTRSPLEGPIVAADPSVVDQQAARVEAAGQRLAAAQAEFDAAAADNVVHGPGSGHSRAVIDGLSEAVFDARRDFTAQRDLLVGLDGARTEVGGRPVGIPGLPDNAEVQAFPAPPSIASQFVDANANISEEINKATFGMVPDVAHDIDVFTNWGEHSGAEQAGAVLDVVGSVPLPGAKPLTEALERGIDAVTGAARHVDDVPTGSAHHGPDAHHRPDLNVGENPPTASGQAPDPIQAGSPPALPSDSPLFDGYDPTPPGPQFTNPDGSLLYPDDSLASKPYAVPGTVIDDVQLAPGTELGRFGYPGGSYVAPDGTRFAELALPPW
ncbi:MAG: glycohydrolase toxin TNT-related protein [Leucobacter sp.]